MEFDLQEYKSAWNLDQDVHHCNHGSFGAVPIVVQEAQKKIQDRVQSNPVKFFARQAMSEVQEARSKVAAFLGQKPEQIVLVRNTTEAASTTMRGFPFKAGDEAIVLDHEYGAVIYAVQRAVEAAGGTTGGKAPTGGNTFGVFYENDNVMVTDYTITTNRNAMSAGPITVNPGVTLTVPAGSTYTIV